MTFQYPWVLTLVVLPLALAIWEWHRAGLRVPLPFDDVEELPRGVLLERGVRAAQLLPSALVACAIVILAGPQSPGEPRDVREVTNIELCLDVSGSMNADLGEGTRYDAAMEAMTGFTEKREGDAFGLTIFGNETLHWVPLTTDLSALQNAAPFVAPGALPRHFGGTEIGKGLRYCRDTLNKTPDGDRLIILLSDGQSADIQGNAAAELGLDLAYHGITLYSIFIGSGEATQQLIDVTEPTGGAVFAVDEAGMLETVFSHIDEMEPARMKPSHREPVDDFSLVAIVGLCVLGVYATSLFGARFSPW